MNKFLVSLGLMVLLGVGGLAAFTGTSAPKNPEVEKEELKKPWVEVLSPRLSLWNTASSTEIQELKTGDEVEAGATLHVDANGLANLYFPNGSMVRLDKDTTLTITQADYDPKTDSIGVRVSLSVGKIWSKVVSLVTPDSVWEVETANTVVTVRGTAFGVQVAKNGKSTVVGSEGKVAAKKKDQKEEVLVTADTFVAVEKAATTTERLVVKTYTDEISHDQWVRENKTEDRKVEAKIELIRQNIKNEVDVRREFRRETQEGFRPRIELRRTEPRLLPSPAPVLQRGVDGPVPNQAPKPGDPLLPPRTNLNGQTIIKTPPTPIQSQLQPTIRATTTVVTAPVPVGVHIKPLGKDVFAEGETYALRAGVAFRDAPSREITSEAVWKVIGPIGSITPSGFFTAKLAPEIAENGTGKGFIVVTWKNPKTGEEFLGKTPAITVNAAVSVTEERAI